MKITVKLKREMFAFSSKTHWANKSASWFENCGIPKSRYVAIDAAGRICVSGKEFIRAEKENTYPVTVYEID